MAGSASNYVGYGTIKDERSETEIKSTMPTHAGINRATDDETQVTEDERRPLTEDDVDCCPSCTWTEKTKTIDDIRKGDHICYRPNCCTPYIHHAIVGGVKTETSELDLIQFIRAGFCQSRCEIKQSTEKYNDQMEVVKYPNQARNSPVKTIENARNEIEKQEPYSIFFNNCEHFCYRATLGKNRSRQVQGCVRRCGLFVQHIFFFFAWLLKFVQYFLAPLIITAPVVIEYAAFVVLGAVCIIRLIFCVVRMHCSREKNGQGSERNNGCTSMCVRYCNHCYKRHNKIRWMRFTVFVIIQWICLGLEKYFLSLDKVNALAILSMGILFSIFTLILNCGIPHIPCFRNRYQHSNSSA